MVEHASPLEHSLGWRAHLDDARATERHSSEDYHVEAVYPSGVYPMNMAFRNKDELWVSDSVSGFIYKLDMSRLPPHGFPSLKNETCDYFDLQAEVPERL